jgi:(heptosyl)LPS beta-1,4-glucosyltransferase
VRLVDRTRGHFAERAVHGVVAAPSVGRLAGSLEHDTLRSLAQYLPKLHDYALRGAADLLAEGRRAGAIRVLAHAEWRFVRSFVLRLGFLDGGIGFVVAVLSAYGTFLKWAGVWEATTRRRPHA